MRASFFTLRQHLALVAAAAVLPLLGVIGLRYYDDRQDHLEISRHEAMSVARAHARKLEPLLRELAEHIQWLAERPAIAAMRPDACTADLRAVRPIHAVYKELSVIDAAGRAVCTLGVPKSAEPRIAAQAWFSAAQIRGTLVAAPPVPGEFPGRAEMTLAYPVIQPSGTTAGVLRARIDVSVLEAELVDEVAGDASLGVLMSDGTSVFSFTRGAPLSEAAAERILLGELEGVFADGGAAGERMYAYTPVGPLQWKLWHSVPAHRAYAAWRTASRLSGFEVAAALAAMALLGFAAARLIGRPVDALTGTLQAIRAGGRERRAPVFGPREVAEVAKELNAMLDARDIAERELIDSERRYRTVLEAVGDAVLVFDLNSGLVIEANAAAQQLLGRAADELIGMERSDLHPPGEAERCWEMLVAGMHEGARQFPGVALQRKDGSKVVTDASLSCFQLRGRACVAGVFRDVSERERAERELRESEARFRSFAELGSDWYWEQDAQFRFTYFSSSKFATDTWRSAIGKTRWEIHPGEIPDAVMAAHRAVLERHEPFRDFELPENDLMGHKRWISISGDPVFDAAGRFVGYRGIGHDLTERKKSEEALLEEAFFRSAIINQMAQGLCVCQVVPGAPNLQFTVWNPRMVEITGYEMQEINERGWLETICSDPALRVRTLERLSGIPAQGPGEDIEIVRKDGAQRFISLSVQVLQLGGAGTQLLCMVEDVTERKAAERELRLAAHVFGSINEAMLITDAENRIVAVNDAFTRVTGYARDDVIGRSPRLLRSDRHDESFYQAMWSEIAREGAWRGEIWNRRKNGDVYPEQLAISVVRDERGEVRYYIGGSFDITERKQREEEVNRLNRELEQRVHERTAQLAEANRELEAFSYSVSHDLRAPLRAINGFSRRLVETRADALDAEGRDYLERVVRACARMSALIEGLLALSRITRAGISMGPVDLSAVAAEALDRLAEEHPRRTVERSIAPGLVVVGDEALLRNLLENLLGNAWKFTSRSDRPRIEFGMLGEAGSAVYYVRDNGAGFDMTYAKRLFEPFQRMHSSEEFEGSGIGLATARRIVMRHGGRLWADAQPDRGATFHFTLGETHGA